MEILRKQFLRHVGQTSDAPLMIEVARAEGIYFYTPATPEYPEGKRYVDLISGVSVSNVGHGNPAVVEAVCAQARDYMHIMVLESVYFVNSGAEAVEGALKLAKRHTHRTEIVSFYNAYHGSTHGAMSVMGGEEFVGAYRPLLPDTRKLRYNCFEDLAQITERTACVLVEPVQGESGVRPPVSGFLEALRERCSAVGALLIFDEIQTGFGRTGEMFALLKYGVTPDIVCLAKALGGGMPLGAFVSSGEIMAGLRSDPLLGHITTFGGHPVCCAAGLAALTYMQEHRLAEQAEAKGRLFEELLADHPAVVEIRRSGLLLAVELGSSERLYRAMELLKEVGYLSDWFLFCDTAFRISPPLTMTEVQVRECCAEIRAGVLDKL